MAAKLPYMVAAGLIPKIFEKIQNARRPERFTQDFLETKLGHSGGSARPVIPLLKRMGFLGSDGVPTALYDQFRNTETQGLAVAQGIRNAFSELFDRNQYVYEMSRDKLTGQVMEITGGAKDDRTIRAIVGTFWALKELADFEGEAPEKPAPEPKPDATPSARLPTYGIPPIANADNVELRVGYTINLNLPETTDPEVFNAIFKALYDNLLKN
jgi:Family of unknown function (DUF5343)